MLTLPKEQVGTLRSFLKNELAYKNNGDKVESLSRNLAANAREVMNAKQTLLEAFGVEALQPFDALTLMLQLDYD